MKKLTAIISAGLIVAMPLYGCTFTTTMNNVIDEDNSSITQSFEENEDTDEKEERTEAEEETDTTTDNTDDSAPDNATVASQTITLSIMECKAAIYSKNDSVYDGVSTYEDTSGIVHTLPKASDSYPSIDENGNAVEHTTNITIADVAGAKQINDLFKPVSYNNDEYNPYWVIKESRCLFLNAEGNSFENRQFDMTDINILPLSKDGTPDNELFVHTLLELN